MMTPEIITETVRLLAPALPGLILAGNEAVKEVGKAAGGAVLDAGKEIWDWLRPHAEADPALLKAATAVAKNPDNPDRQAVLRVQLEDLLEAKPQLGTELQSLLQQVRVTVQRNTVTASGAGAVAIGGNFSDGSISTHVGLPKEDSRPG